MPLGAALLLMMLAALGASPAAADETVTAAHVLLSAWHEDPARIDRARALLETAAAADPTGDALTELSRVWFLTGDFRARGEAERVTAYERGAEAAKRAITLAPRNDRAHLWLAINSGRIAEIKGVGRALALVGTIREESETVLKINPASVEGLVLAGGLAARCRYSWAATAARRRRCSSARWRSIHAGPGTACSWPGSTSPRSAGQTLSASCRASWTRPPPRIFPAGR